MTGNLDPHTMVQCAAYRPKDYVEDLNSRSRGGPTLDAPFQVVAHPDAVFVADLHAHLATCEIIGFLGGKWDEVSKTLYIQAAFPCRSLVIDGDDGSTDVEMDPGSEIELRGIIENAQLEVVGWYHSHPAFAPDPSVRDIENQTSYQQLFQRPNISKEANGESKISEPFVGLIVGTYDTRRSTPVSLFRYFHTRGEKVTGGARREIYMPYEFIPDRRHFRSVLQDEEREKTRLFPIYHSVLQHFKFELVAVEHQHHLPTDIIATHAKRPTSKSSPSRTKAQGHIRKRKQSSDGAGDKPVKKVKAPSKRSTHSSSATESRIDFTGADGSQNLQVLENGSAVAPTPTPMIENGGMNLAATVDPNGTTVEEEKAANITVSSPVSHTKQIDTKPNAKSSTEMVKLATGDVELQVIKTLEDVKATDISNGSDDKHESSKKDHKPKEMNENSDRDGFKLSRLAKEVNENSDRDDFKLSRLAKEVNENSDRDGFKQSRTDDAAMHDPMGATSAHKQQHHADNKSSDMAKSLKVDSSVATKDTNDNITQAAVISVAMLTTNNTVTNRKRGRKPKVTTRNNNWLSPGSGGPSPGRSPSPIKHQSQSLYDVFSSSGPVVSNGSNHEEVIPPPSRPDYTKPDTLLDETQYIDVNHENLGMIAPNAVGERSVEDNVDKATLKTKKHGEIEQEARSSVTSMLEKVDKEVATETPTVKLSAHDSKEAPSLSVTLPVVVNGSADKMSVDGTVKAETECERTTPDSAMDTMVNKTIEPPSKIATKGKASVKLFGSNGEFEDIQTSLQKMSVHLTKLRTLQATDFETTSLVDAASKAESNPDMVKFESKQDAPKVEQDYLTALRTKYGPGVNGCAEQVITLVDYYRDFERRTDLDEVWKARITKLEKIESSLSEYVQFLNIRAALRRDFIKVRKIDFDSLFLSCLPRIVQMFAGPYFVSA
ncbi:Metalloprotease [Phytophthora megakarya]|uniref:Metalloprotease n=1 Tax=Phytophthora megakarya TaxID=4795 RepID=A0A225WFL2_9STRA|nr:Metalloprotease [Phytophthora megakarya]